MLWMYRGGGGLRAGKTGGILVNVDKASGMRASVEALREVGGQKYNVKSAKLILCFFAVRTRTLLPIMCLRC